MASGSSSVGSRSKHPIQVSSSAWVQSSNEAVLPFRSAVAMAAPGQTGADIASEQTVRDRKGVCHVVVEDEVVRAVPGWGAQLLTSTRFAHSAAYIDLLGLLHGLRTISCRSAVLRSEGSSPVYGIMYVLQRVCHAD